MKSVNLPMIANRITLVVLTTLLWVSLCVGDNHLKVEGDVVTVVKSLPCKVIAPEGADFYLWTFPDSIKATSSDNVLNVTNAPKGSHRINAVSITVEIDFEKKTKRIVKRNYSVDLNVGEVKPPDPDPDPKPPTDPLVKSLKDAYNQERDTKKVEHLQALSALYRQAAKMDLSGIQTIGELFTKLAAASRTLLPADALKSVRQITGAEIQKVVGNRSDEGLTDEMRQRVQALFARLGDALMEAGK